MAKKREKTIGEQDLASMKRRPVRGKGPLERKIKPEPITRKESLDYENLVSPVRGKGPLERKAAPKAAVKRALKDVSGGSNYSQRIKGH